MLMKVFACSYGNFEVILIGLTLDFRLFAVTLYKSEFSVSIFRQVKLHLSADECRCLITAIFWEIFFLFFTTSLFLFFHIFRSFCIYCNFSFLFYASAPRIIGMNVADTTIASEYCLCPSNELKSEPIRII